MKLPIPSSTSCCFSGAHSSTKKSHARQRSPSHIPRPKNAFILFRCDFVAQDMVPASVEKDHRNISRIVGKIWKGLSESEKRPWVELAKREKIEHKERFPDYKYRSSVMARRKGESPSSSDTRDPVPSSNTSERSQLPHRRTSSCPPPNSFPVLVPDAQYPSTMSLDDLAPTRRPSCATMYHSAPAFPTMTTLFPTTIIDDSYPTLSYSIDNIRSHDMTEDYLTSPFLPYSDTATVQLDDDLLGLLTPWPDRANIDLRLDPPRLSSPFPSFYIDLSSQVYDEPLPQFSPALRVNDTTTPTNQLNDPIFTNPFSGELQWFNSTVPNLSSEVLVTPDVDSTPDFAMYMRQLSIGIDPRTLLSPDISSHDYSMADATAED